MFLSTIGLTCKPNLRAIWVQQFFCFVFYRRFEEDDFENRKLTKPRKFNLMGQNYLWL